MLEESYSAGFYKLQGLIVPAKSMSINSHANTNLLTPTDCVILRAQHKIPEFV